MGDIRRAPCAGFTATVRRDGTRAKSLAILGCAAFLAASEAGAASPLPTRDQNPLLAEFGLPMLLPARLPAADSWSLTSSINWSSSAIAQANAREALVVDAETRELRVAIARALGERVAVQIQAPFRYIGPGVLDSLIDDWHDLFGLPEGARPVLPRDQLLIAYERNGVSIVDRRSSHSGLGNVSADLGLRLADRPATYASVWLSLKLPTGALELPGENTTDLALSAVGEHRFAERWSLFGQASISYLGRDATLGNLQNRFVWGGYGGIGVRTWRSLELKLQVDAHTAVMDDTELDYLGEAVVLSVGGSYEFTSGWQLDIGISEDISVDASPDVVLVFGLRRSVSR